MKRATIIRRNVRGEELATLDGWRAEIDGVTVVLCRTLGKPRRWVCCEPRTGLEISGRVAATRAAVLEATTSEVEKVARTNGQSPGDFLTDLTDRFYAAQPCRGEKR